MGSGGLFFDYDDDGWLDLFLVDGGSFADPAVARQARHRLFRNRGNGTFHDVTAQSGIQHRDYGMGACAVLDASEPCPDHLVCEDANSCFDTCGSNDTTGDARCTQGFWCDGSTCMAAYSAE